MRSARLAAALAAALLVATPSLHAQSSDASPRSGTWGAEAVYGDGFSANLLYFSSPSAAWLAGASFTVGRETQDVINFPGATTTETTWNGFVSGRLGRRWWSGAATERFRPLRGVGLLGQMSGTSGARLWSAGVYGELGGTYFFSPHLSLGASGQLGASYSHDRFASGAATIPDRTDSRVTLGGSLARVAAGVYF